jgi:hypothetical protein
VLYDGGQPVAVSDVRDVFCKLGGREDRVRCCSIWRMTKQGGLSPTKGENGGASVEIRRRAARAVVAGGRC